MQLPLKGSKGDSLFWLHLNMFKNKKSGVFLVKLLSQYFIWLNITSEGIRRVILTLFSLLTLGTIIIIINGGVYYWKNEIRAKNFQVSAHKVCIYCNTSIEDRERIRKRFFQEFFREIGKDSLFQDSLLVYINKEKSQKLFSIAEIGKLLRTTAPESYSDIEDDDFLVRNFLKSQYKLTQTMSLEQLYIFFPEFEPVSTAVHKTYGTSPSQYTFSKSTIRYLIDVQSSPIILIIGYIIILLLSSVFIKTISWIYDGFK